MNLDGVELTNTLVAQLYINPYAKANKNKTKVKIKLENLRKTTWWTRHCLDKILKKMVNEITQGSF